MSDLLPGLVVLAIVALVLPIFAIPMLTLIGPYAVLPHRASTILVFLRAWMGRCNRTITVVLCLVFGAFSVVRVFTRA